MRKTNPGLASLFTVLFLVSATQAQNSSNLWQGVEQVPQGKTPAEIWVQPQVFSAFNLNHGMLRPLLGRAPKERASGALGTTSPTNAGSLGTASPTISLPLPDGTLAQFRFVD